MKKIVFLVLSAVGFIAPNIYTFKVSIETGNWLFWLDPSATMAGMFANDTSTAFIIDLLVAVYVFFIWAWVEGRRLGMRHVWVFWVLTLVWGVAGPLPLFLYFRERRLEALNGVSSSSR